MPSTPESIEYSKKFNTLLLEVFPSETDTLTEPHKSRRADHIKEMFAAYSELFGEEATFPIFEKIIGDFLLEERVTAVRGNHTQQRDVIFFLETRLRDFLDNALKTKLREVTQDLIDLPKQAEKLSTLIALIKSLSFIQFKDQAERKQAMDDALTDLAYLYLLTNKDQNIEQAFSEIAAYFKNNVVTIETQSLDVYAQKALTKYANEAFYKTAKTAKLLEEHQQAQDSLLVRALGKVEVGVGTSKGAHLTSVLVLLSGLGNLAAILAKFAKGIFGFGVMLNVVEAGVAVADVSTAPNKNAGKTVNATNKMIDALLVGTAVVAGVFFGLFSPVPVLVASFAVVLGRGIVLAAYHAIKAVRADNPAVREFHKQRAKHTARDTAIMGAALVVLTLALLFTPHIAIPVLAAMTLTAGVAVVGFTLYKLSGIISNHFKAKKAAKEQQTSKQQKTVGPALASENEKTVQATSDIKIMRVLKPQDKQTVEALKKEVSADIVNGELHKEYFGGDYYGNAIKSRQVDPTKLTPEMLLLLIRSKMKALVNQESQKSTVVKWYEGDKVDNKIAALKELSDFIQSYNNQKTCCTPDAFNQFYRDIKSTYKNAFQSFSMQQGDVDTLFGYALVVCCSEQPASIQENDALDNVSVAINSL